MKEKLQKRKNKLKLSFFTVLFTAISISAQDYSVTPLSDFVKIYKEKSTIISEQIEADKKISSEEKLVFFKSKMTRLREDFKSSRKSEYLSKSVKRAKRLICKGTRIRGVTNCQSVSATSPIKIMYTKEDWVEVEGEAKYIKVDIDSASARLSISVTGTRTNKGAVYATFKYKPNVVPSIVEKEAEELFSQIIDTNK